MTPAALAFLAACSAPSSTPGTDADSKAPTCNVTLGSPADGYGAMSGPPSNFEWTCNCVSYQLELSTYERFPKSSTLRFTTTAGTFPIYDWLWVFLFDEDDETVYWRVVGTAGNKNNNSEVRTLDLTFDEPPPDETTPDDPPPDDPGDTGEPPAPTDGCDVGASASVCDDYGTPGLTTPMATGGFTQIWSCGNVWSNAVLMADVGTSDDCLEVQTDGITIEGAGHTAGVSLRGHTGVTVRNVKGWIDDLGPGTVVEHNELDYLGVYTSDVVVKNNVLGGLALKGLDAPIETLRTQVIGNHIEGDGNALVDIQGALSDVDIDACPVTGHLIEGNTIVSTTTDWDEPKILMLRCAQGNTIRCNTIEAAEGHGAHGLRVRDQSNDNLIEYNTVIARDEIGGALYITSGNSWQPFPADNTVQNNLFVGRGASAVRLQGTGGNNRLQHNVFWSDTTAPLVGDMGDIFDHNSFWMASNGPIATISDLGANGMTWTSNVLATAGDDIFTWDHTPNAATWTGDWNVYYGASGTPSIGGSPWTSWAAATGDEDASRAGDPRFTNVNAYDLSLLDGSAAIGAGENASNAGACP